VIKPACDIWTISSYVIVLALTLLPTVQNAASAATYYVAKTGNNAYTCAQAQSTATPKLTIASGLTCVRADDTLYIRNGTYAETIDSNDQTIPTGTSWDNAPIISSYPGETATIQGGRGEAILNLPHAYIQYVSFENLVLNGLDLTDMTISIGYSGAHHVRFKNIEAMHASHHIAQIQGHHHIFTGGKFHHAGNEALWAKPLNHYGFYVSGSDMLFENFEMYAIDDYAIHNGNSNPPYPNRNIYRNLRIHDVAHRTASYSAVIIWSGDSHLIYNCVIYNSGSHGIQISGPSVVNARVYNNTIYRTTYTGIQIGAFGATNTIVKNNIIYNTGAGPINVTTDATGTILDKNLTGVNPQFVNAATNNFRLLSTSPAIDKGATISEVTQDFAGLPRPQGSAHDIGAYEFSANQSDAPPSAPIGLSIR
jgi:hypothetical protein